MPEALVGERPEPEQRRERRQTRGRERDCGAPPFAEPNDGVRGERDQREERIGRVHKRQLAERGGKSERERPRPRLQVSEEERDRHRHEQLLRSGRRKSEQRPRAAVTRSEAVEAELRGEHREAGRRRVEHGDPRLPDDDARERSEQRRLMLDDDSRVEPRDLRDERVEPVPERKRVAGMEAAVLELVDRAQVQVAEVDELAHAGEVEEPVAGDDPRDVPEERAEHDSAGEDGGSAAKTAEDGPPPKRRNQRRDADHCEHTERERDRAVHGEDERPRGEDRGQPPRNRCRRRPLPERARDEPAGQQHDRSRRSKAQVVDQRRSDRTSPEARKRAPSR